MRLLRDPIFWAIIAVVLMFSPAIVAIGQLFTTEPVLVVVGRKVGNVDLLTLIAAWFPWVSALVGLCLLGAIYRQNSVSRLSPPVAPPLPATVAPHSSTPQIDPTEPYFRGRTIRIVDIVQPNADLIENKTFEDCRIVGPAVLAPMGVGMFEYPIFEAPSPAAIEFEIRMPRTIIGPIGVKDCIFRRCTFSRIGLVADRGFFDRMKAELLKNQKQ